VENLSEIIRQIRFFSGLSREDLARIAGKLEEEIFSAAEVIFSQGEIGDALYIIQSGAAEVLVEHEGLRTKKAILGPYESFGEMSLFSGEKRSATVIALVDSVVLKLSKETWEELLAKYPSLSLHFCKAIIHRLTETERDMSKGRGAFNLVMEKFFAAQPVQVQDFLLRTSAVKALDPGAIQSVLSISDPIQILAGISQNYPAFIRAAKNGNYEYLDHLSEFLSAKLEQGVGKEEINKLHLGYANYFSTHAKWAPALHHYIKSEAWEEAVEQLKDHGSELLQSEPPREILEWLDCLPNHLLQTDGYLTRLRAEANVRLGDLDSAIRSYKELIAQKVETEAGALEAAKNYQELAELHQKKGETGEAFGDLSLGLSMLEDSRVDLDAVEAIRSIEILQQKGGSQEAAISWGNRALNVAQRLGAQSGTRILSQNRKWLGLLLAFAIGWGLWQLPPPTPLDERGVHFLATMAAGVILWSSGLFDDYIVALLLLLVWLISGIVPSEMALAGFSKSSWFFVLGVLGIGAAVTKSGLLYRVALQVLRRIPADYKFYTFILTVSGLLTTPLLPNIKGRIAIMSPVSQAIAESMGFKPRSNGSAGIILSTYIGFSQMTFMFLTGATVCLIGWNLLPEAAKEEFGWGTWALAALPAGIFTLLFLLGAIHLLYRVKEHTVPNPKTLKAQLEILGPLTRGEWFGIAVLALALVGWLGKPLHGISEAWVALGALLVFLATGVLDKKGLKNNIDWGYLLFLGVITSTAVIMPHLKVDRWLIGFIGPILSPVSFQPLSFLMVVILLVYLLRFFLRKDPTVILLLLVLTSWAQAMEIHPGVLLITILMATETWFLPYQTASYQIAYYSTDEKGFSHAQARKLMVAKLFASLLALTISDPYWRMLGLIR
jgi:anion transporter